MQRLYQDSGKQRTRPFEVPTEKQVYIHCQVYIHKSEVDKTKFINVIVGDIDVPEKMYLIECCVTETVNQSIICMKIDDILHKLDIAKENFHLLLSDATITAIYNGLHSDLPVLKRPPTRTSRDRHNSNTSVALQSRL